MYLKAIELHGFKSFPDKTRIEFDRSMSVIVGPNGSGKSNISDAVKWVLGETRPSQLRGNGKMEDVIFGGTTKRNPMGFASVSLVLDNTARNFDVDSDEITVTRKYYRGGDSEYLINGARVRLRDIQELFFDTGLGKNGYSIVSQGKVNEIVTSKPEDRREIFEEASGIAKFRFRKNEAERKLEQSQENIDRLNDILSGLEERVGPLEKESEKAKQFLEYSRDKKKLEISLWLDTVDKSKEQINTQKERLGALNEDYQRLSDESDEKEKYIEERYLYANSLIAKSDENVNAIRDDEKKISNLNAEKAVLESEKAANARQIAALNTELSGFDTRGSATAAEKDRLEKSVALYDERILTRQKKQAALQVKLDKLTADAAKNGDEKGRLAGNLNALRLKIQDAKIDISSRDTQNETIKQSAETVESNIAAAKKFRRESAAQRDEVKEFIDVTDETITRNTNIRNGLLMKKKSADEKYARAVAKRDENAMARRTAEDRMRILTELENSMDGFSQSVKQVLKKAKDGSLGGILGSVAQVISVEKGYETAIETALGGALQNIVTRDESSAKRAIEYLRQTKGGRATFYPLDTMRPSTFSENLPEWAQTADKVIKADAKYKNVVSNLLGRTIVVDNINSASSLAKKLNYRYRIVTLDGQLVNAGGSFTGGSVSKNAGLFTRKTEIEALKKKLDGLKKDSAELVRARDSAKEALDALNVQAAGYDEEIAKLTSDRANAQIEYARLSQAVQGYDDTVANLEDTLRTYNETTVANNNRKLALLGEVSEMQKQARDLEKRIGSLDAKDARSAARQTKTADEIRQAKIDIVSLQGDRALENSRLEQILADMETREERRMEILGSIARYEGENRAKDAAIAGRNGQADALRADIAAKEEENRNIVTERMAIEQERTRLTAESRDLTAQREELYSKAAKLQERIASMETAYDDVISKLWEEYELTVSNAREFAVEVTDENAMKRELARVRNSIRKLGNVNVGAIEEYREVSEKYTYLKAQMTDLTDSRAQLVKLISSLNSEMKTLFTESFGIINENFGRIFTELFGGGSAHLELTDPEDVLSSGIEILVSPPGKVIKSLNALSGGEQALVAISIYFAILAHNPSPFCVLDEIEAALDDVNVNRYASYLHRISDKTQFIVITHRRGTMEAADVLYGVTMQDDGISKLLKLDTDNLSPSILN